MENLIKTVFARTALFAAKVVSPAVRPGYLPLGLAPDGAITVAQLEKLRAEAHSSAANVTRSLLKNVVPGKHKAKQDNQQKQITPVDMKENLLKIKATFEEFTKKDPDALASMLVLQMCDGMPGMDNFDNQRRVVQTWSAILAPSVVIRERDGVPITAKGMIESALMWVEHGYTKDAERAYAQSKSRFIAAHPARAYTLLADTASQLELDHQKLMFVMLSPVINALASFEGSMRILDDTDLNSKDENRG